MVKSLDNMWEKIHESQGWGGYPSEHVIRFVARNYYSADRGNIRILDFGCGQGAHTWYLAREGFDTYAFDGSESAVKKAKERMKQERLKASFVVTDGLSLPYSSNYFDAVIDNVCIYANRMENIRAMYKRVMGILKPGGKLLTVCFGEDLDGYESGDEIEPGTFKNIKDGVLADRGLSHIYRKDEIIGLLKETGFENVENEWIKYTDGGKLVHQYVCRAEKRSYGIG